MSPRIAVGLVRAVRLRASNSCEYCRLPQASQEAAFHADHVLPRSLGGPTALANLCLACVTCSLRKAARVRAPDPLTGKTARLFNPRQDGWTRHFVYTKNGRLHGKTAVGRATITALGMNRPAIVAIRRELVALGRFPASDE